MSDAATGSADVSSSSSGSPSYDSSSSFSDLDFESIDDVSTLRQHLRRFHSDLERARSETSRLKNHTVELEESISELKANNAAIRTELEESNLQIASLQSSRSTVSALSHLATSFGLTPPSSPRQPDEAADETSSTSGSVPSPLATSSTDLEDEVISLRHQLADTEQRLTVLQLKQTTEHPKQLDTIAELRDQIQSIKTERDEAISNLRQATSMAREDAEALQALQMSSMEQEETLSERDEQITKLRSLIARLKKQNREHQDKVRTIQMESGQKLRSVRKELSDANKALEAFGETTADDYKKLNAKYHRNRTRSQKNREVFRRKIGLLEDQLVATEKERDALSSLMLRTEDVMDQMEATSLEKETRIQSLERLLEERPSVVVTPTPANDDQIERLREELAVAQKARTAAEFALTSSKQITTRLETELNDKTRQITSLQQEIDSRPIVIEQKKTVTEEEPEPEPEPEPEQSTSLMDELARADVTSLQMKLMAANWHIKSLQDKIERSGAEKQTLEDQIIALEEEKEGFGDRVEEFENQIKRLNAQWRKKVSDVKIEMKAMMPEDPEGLEVVVDDDGDDALSEEEESGELSRSLRLLKRQLAERNAILIQKQKTIAKTNAVSAMKNVQISGMKKRTSTLRDELKKARFELNEKNEEIEQLREELEATHQDNETAENHEALLDNYERKIVQLTAHLKGAENEASISGTKKRVTQLKMEQMTNEQKRLGQVIRDNKKEMDRMQRQIQVLTDMRDDEIQRLQRQLRTERERSDRLSEEISTTATPSAHERNRSTLIRTYQESVVELRRENIELKRKLGVMERRLRSGQLARQQSIRAPLRKEIETLKREIEKKDRVIATMRQSRTESYLGNRRGAIDKLNSLLAQRDRRVKALERRIVSVRNDGAGYQAKNRELQIVVAKREERIMVLAKEITALKLENGVMKRQLTDLRAVGNSRRTPQSPSSLRSPVQGSRPSPHSRSSTLDSRRSRSLLNSTWSFSSPSSSSSSGGGRRRRRN